MGVREKPHSVIIARGPRDVTLLDRAVADLLDLQAVERKMLAGQIDLLARDMLPRGAAALEGAFRDHCCLRVGRFRILYRVLDHDLTVVAITTRTE